jgi:hypothetical protein
MILSMKKPIQSLWFVCCLALPLSAYSANPAPSSKSAGVDTWTREMKSFLKGYLADQWTRGMKFSIESCRPDEMKLFQLLVGSLKSFTHEYKFKKDCDLEGTVTLRLRSPMDVDLETRNLGSVTRFQGLVTVTPGKSEGMGLEMKVLTTVDKGIAFEGDTKAAKFTVDHSKVMGVDMLQMALETRSQAGTLKVTEFRGKPVSLSEKF